MATMDTAARLAELTAEFRVRSERKHAEAGLSGYAEILYGPPSMVWGCDPHQGGQVTYHLQPQSWCIVYRNGEDEQVQVGAVIGHTRAAAISFLLRQRRAFP